MARDWVLIEITMIRIQNENTIRHIIKTKGVCTKPMIAKQIQNKIKEKIRGTRLSNLETSHPDIGSPIIEPTGIANRTLPKTASLKLKKSLIVGILEAQEAKHTPDKKK